MKEALVIHPKKASLRLTFAVLLLCFILSLAVLMNVERIMFGQLRIATMIVGFVGVVCFGYLGLYAFMRMQKATELIRCDENGLRFHVHDLYQGLLDWEAIAAYEIVQYGLSKRALIRLKRPELYIYRQKGVQAWLMRLNQKRYGTPIAIPVALFSEDPSEALIRISKWSRIAN